MTPIAQQIHTYSLRIQGDRVSGTVALAVSTLVAARALVDAWRKDLRGSSARWVLTIVDRDGVPRWTSSQ